MSDLTQYFENKKLGFGLMRLPQVPDKRKVDLDMLIKMVDAYMANGFRYFDTAYSYHFGKSETMIAKALVERYPRDAFCLADKLPTWMVRSSEDYETLFSVQCKRCAVDFFDFYLLHNIDAEIYKMLEETGGFQFLQQLKAEGKARFIGFSYHDKAPLLDTILTAHPEVEFVQIQLNYFDWESSLIQSRACLEVCNKHNVPVIVMEPVHGGGLANNLPVEAKTLFHALDAEASPASFAMRFAGSQKGVMMVLSGMSDMAQLEDNMQTMGNFRPFTDEEYKTVAKITALLNGLGTIACTGCGYCLEDCPKEILIPNLFAIYNQKRMFGEVNFPGMHYEINTQSRGSATDCIGCGNCESHCPQHLAVREYLKTVGSTFGY
ncbi:MAG: aldo/keto reductase [Oscillospiraceae bacterium]